MAEVFSARLAVVSEATRAETKLLLRSSTKLARLWPGPPSSLDAWMNEIDEAAVVMAMHEDDYYREMSRCCLAKVVELEQELMSSAMEQGPGCPDKQSATNFIALVSPGQSTQSSSPGRALSSLPNAQQQQQQHRGSELLAGSGGAQQQQQGGQWMSGEQAPLLASGTQERDGSSGQRAPHGLPVPPSPGFGYGLTAVEGASSSGSKFVTGGNGFMLQPQLTVAPPLMLNQQQSFRFMHDPVLSPLSPALSQLRGGSSIRLPALTINTEDLLPADPGATPRGLGGSAPPTFLHPATTPLQLSFLSTPPAGPDSLRNQQPSRFQVPQASWSLGGAASSQQPQWLPAASTAAARR